MRAYSMSGSGTIVAGNSLKVPNPTVTGCMSACTGTIDGNFYGALAERVGIVYKVNDVSRTITGAAGLVKQ